MEPYLLFQMQKRKKGERIAVNFCHQALSANMNMENVNLFNEIIIPNPNAVVMLQNLFLTAITKGSPDVVEFLSEHYKQYLIPIPQETLHHAFDVAMHNPKVPEDNLSRLFDIFAPKRDAAAATSEPKLRLDLSHKDTHGKNILSNAIECERFAIATKLAASPDQPREAFVAMELMQNRWSEIDAIERKGIAVRYSNTPRSAYVTPRDIPLALSARIGDVSRF